MTVLAPAPAPLLGLVGLLALGSGPTAAQASPSASPTDLAASPDPDEVGPRFEVALLAAPRLDEAGLEAALALRLPELELRTQWSDDPRPGRVFIRVSPTKDGIAVRTEVITDDGRGYARRLDVPPDDVRRISSVLANLLFSIEDDAVPADARDVDVPKTSEAEEVERAVAELESPEPPEPKAASAVEEPPPLEDGEADDVGENAKPPPQPRPQPREPADLQPPPPTWMASVPLSGGVLLPVGGPRFGSLLQGGGLGIGADAEHRSGARTGLRLRYLARESAGFRLSRLRVAAGAGYGWRVGRLDLPLRAELSVEPWWLIFEGDRLGRAQLGTSRVGTVALGGGLRFEPAMVLPMDAGSLASLRVGLSMGLAGSFVVDGGPQVAVVSSGEPDTFEQELFRIGGLELWLGAGISVVLRRRPSSSR